MVFCYYLDPKRFFRMHPFHSVLVVVSLMKHRALSILQTSFPAFTTLPGSVSFVPSFSSLLCTVVSPCSTWASCLRRAHHWRSICHEGPGDTFVFCSYSPSSTSSALAFSGGCGLRRSPCLLAAVRTRSKPPSSAGVRPLVSSQGNKCKKACVVPFTEKKMVESFNEEEFKRVQEENTTSYPKGGGRKRQSTLLGHSSFSSSFPLRTSPGGVAPFTIEDSISPAELTPQQLEERDIRAAVRHVLSQYFMQTSIEKRKLKFAEEEKKQDEEKLLAALERELERQEAFLRRQVQQEQKKKAASSSSVGDNGIGMDHREQSSLLQPSPSSLIQVYANTILSGLTEGSGTPRESSSAGEKSSGGSPGWTMADLQRLHHHIRMRRRQEEKERRAETLSGPAGTNAVGGVLPVHMPDSISTGTTGGSAGASSFSSQGGGILSGWRTPIGVHGGADMITEDKAFRVEEAARETLRQQDVATSLSLHPDLSAYSAENDIRISSEHVVRAQRRERERQYRHLTSPSSTSLTDFTAEPGVLGEKYDDQKKKLSSSFKPEKTGNDGGKKGKEGSAADSLPLFKEKRSRITHNKNGAASTHGHRQQALEKEKKPKGKQNDRKEEGKRRIGGHYLTNAKKKSEKGAFSSFVVKRGGQGNRFSSYDDDDTEEL